MIATPTVSCSITAYLWLSKIAAYVDRFS